VHRVALGQISPDKNVNFRDATAASTADGIEIVVACKNVHPVPYFILLSNVNEATAAS